MSHLLCYTRRMKNMKNNITEAQLLLNQEVKINAGQFRGKTAFVRKVMADGRSLEVEIAHTSGKIAFVDVALVSEIQEPYNWPKQEQSLGPDANSLLPKNRL